MFGSTMIDIGIGIVFVFLLLSLVASTVNEMILSFLNMRGKELLRGLQTLLNDDTGGGLVADVYNHGLVFGLFQGNFDLQKPHNLPSYIPPKIFVAALIDVVAPSAELKQDEKAMLEALRTAAQALAAKPATEKVGKPLVAMIDSAGTSSEKLRQNIEGWYNSAMDRVSGWYKYRTQWTLFGIGLFLGLALNVSPVRIVQQLSKDPTLRQSIVAAAQAAKPPADSSAQPKQIENQVTQIESLGIPLGWSGESLPKEWYQWPELVLGWLLTALAVSLGAPFWFDLLNKIMVVRSTVKPREKSQEEPSKD